MRCPCRRFIESTHRVPVTEFLFHAQWHTQYGIGACVHVAPSKFSSPLPYDKVRLALTHPMSPYGTFTKKQSLTLSYEDCYIALDSIDRWLWKDTQSFVSSMVSDDRLSRREKSNELLQATKAEMLAKAGTPAIARITRGMNESQRDMYTNVKAELLEQIHIGRIEPLSDLEIERVSLLTMVELQGLINIIENPGAVMADREALAFANLCRQLGNEGQRVRERAQQAKVSKKSTFDALEELAKKGVSIHLKKGDEEITMTSDKHGYVDMIEEADADDIL